MSIPIVSYDYYLILEILYIAYHLYIVVKQMKLQLFSKFWNLLLIYWPIDWFAMNLVNSLRNKQGSLVHFDIQHNKISNHFTTFKCHAIWFIIYVTFLGILDMKLEEWRLTLFLELGQLQSSFFWDVEVGKRYFYHINSIVSNFVDKITSLALFIMPLETIVQGA